MEFKPTISALGCLCNTKMQFIQQNILADANFGQSGGGQGAGFRGLQQGSFSVEELEDLLNWVIQKQFPWNKTGKFQEYMFLPQIRTPYSHGYIKFEGVEHMCSNNIYNFKQIVDVINQKLAELKEEEEEEKDTYDLFREYEEQFGNNDEEDEDEDEESEDESEKIEEKDESEDEEIIYWDWQKK